MSPVAPLAGTLARLDQHVEAKNVDIEVADAIDAGGAQVDVNRAHLWINRPLSGRVRVLRGRVV
jgi:hypothetical protein